MKYTAKGCIFKMGTADTLPATTVTQNGNVSFNPGEREMTKVTTNDSAGGVDEYLPNFLDSADMSQEIIYDPANANHEALRAAHAAGTKISFGVILPDVGNAIYWATGFITGMPLALDMSSPISISFAFKATGPYTFAA
jgi:hypothetical protein